MQLSMFQLDDPVLVQIRDQIKGLDINSLTPIEALNKLNEIKEDNRYLIKRYWKSNIPKPPNLFSRSPGLVLFLIGVILIIHAFFFSYYAFLIFVGTLT